LLVGCVVAAFLTWLMRRYVLFPTYTSPFILTTWGVYFLGNALSAAATDPASAPLVPDISIPFAVEATTHGIGQVMFQASLWTGLLFLAGIAISEWRHALLVLLGSIVGLLVARYHVTLGADAIDPERLITRTQLDTIRLGLYGYNATLAPVALFLWRRTLIPPVLGMVLAVYLSDLMPSVGLPALTAPFVLATWVVLLFGWLESRYLGWGRAGDRTASAPEGA
jgi:urea transporter